MHNHKIHIQSDSGLCAFQIAFKYHLIFKLFNYKIAYPFEINPNENCDIEIQQECTK